MTVDTFSKACPRCGARYDAAAVFCQKDGAGLRLIEEQTRDPRIGQVLLDQFRMEECIGVGGMGMVYRARQTTVGRDVAIKILHPDVAGNPDAVRRFHREARISTALDHPNVVRVFLFGQLNDGSLYLVMELLRGRPLSELLRVEPKLATGRALHIAAQVAEAVGEAHTQGIVHRDIKPENVFLTPKGRDPDFVKVLDFGIARLLHPEDQTSATQAGLVFGTARYISPEGAAGEKTDARSDVYSIGVLLYQMLAGVTPFEGSTPVQLLMAHINERPPPIRSLQPGIPEGVADVVMRALAKNPDARYEDGAHFAEVLRDAAERSGIALRARRGADADVSGRVPLDRGEASQRVPLARSDYSPPRGNAATTDELRVAGLGGKRGGSGLRAAALLGGAFVLGVGGVAAAFWARAHFAEPSAEEVRATRLDSAEHAFAAGHLDGAGEGTLLAITNEMLAARSDDADALRLRHSAADLLAGRARVATQAEHTDEARDLYQRALVLVPGDDALEAALQALDTPPELPSSVTVAPPPVSGQSVVFTATIPESALALTTQPRFVIHLNGRRVGRAIDAIAGGSPTTFVARHTFAQPGHYEVLFRTGESAGAVTVSIEVDVARGTRVEVDPPVTTQGSLGPQQTWPTVPTSVDLPLVGNVEIPPPFVSADPPPTEPESDLPPAWTSQN